MRRWLAVAAVGAAFLTMPLWAQRRGGGFAGHAGFASHGSSFAGHGSMMAGHGSMMSSRGFGFSGIGRGGPHFGTGFNRSFRSPFFSHGHRFFRSRGFGSRFGPYYGYPFNYPWYYGDYESYPSYDSGAYYPQDNGAAQEEQAQIDRLENEVERLRQERQGRESTNTTQSQSQTDLHSQTELVFRDKRTEEVQNYAIVGQTFWIFDQQRTTKVSLSDLDIPATIKANDARGVDFELPR
jgi:hypothetical protein